MEDAQWLYIACESSTTSKAFQAVWHASSAFADRWIDSSLKETKRIRDGSRGFSNMDGGNSLFTIESLASFGGASTATFCVANAMQQAFNFNPRWLGLIVAEMICVGGVVVGQIDGAPITGIAPYFVAALNGFLVFCSAVGMTEVGGRARAVTRQPTTATRSPRMATMKRGFWTPWFALVAEH